MAHAEAQREKQEFLCNYSARETRFQTSDIIS